MKTIGQNPILTFHNHVPSISLMAKTDTDEQKELKQPNEEEEDPFVKLQPVRRKGEFSKGSCGFPGKIKNGGGYNVQLGAPAVDIMNRMVVAFFGGGKYLDSEENWSTWCSKNECPIMASHYDMFASELHDRPSQHNLFQAVRMRYNLEVKISDMQEGKKMEYYYTITLSGDTKQSVMAAVNYLVSHAPKDFKIYLCTPCDYRMGSSLEKEMAIEKFINGPENDTDNDGGNEK